MKRTKFLSAATLARLAAPLLAPLLVIGASAPLTGCGSSSSPATPEGDAALDSLPVDDGALEVGDDSQLPGLSFLAVEPGNATLFLDLGASPVAPATLVYKATMIDPDGTERDVSSTATFTIDDPTLGSFAGATFSSSTTLAAGTAKASVVHITAEGTTTLVGITVAALRKTGAQRDFYFVEPYELSPIPTKDTLTFATNIKQVDVAVSLDTTSSMGGAVKNLKDNLSSKVFPGLAAAIPNVGLSVSYHDDYPVDRHGYVSCPDAKVLPGDLPHGTVQLITTDLVAAQAAANKLEVHCGGDFAEAQLPSMLHILTGNAITWTGGSVPAHAPATGMSGGVDFRPGGVPVVVLITDADWHDPTSPSPNRIYKSNVLAPPTMADVKAAFAAQNAKFVNITSGPEDQANELSDATKSFVKPAAFGGACGAGKCCTGEAGAAQLPTGPGGTCRLNFRHLDGAGVSDGMVRAIQAIAVGSTFDVTAVKSNDPANPGGVDATRFIKSLRAMEEGDAAEGCPAMPGKVADGDGDGVADTFVALNVGTPVCFEVNAAVNDFVPPTADPQFFNAFIDVVGNPGAVKLDRRKVLFLVPPKPVGAQ